MTGSDEAQAADPVGGAGQQPQRLRPSRWPTRSGSTVLALEWCGDAVTVHRDGERIGQEPKP